MPENPVAVAEIEKALEDVIEHLERVDSLQRMDLSVKPMDLSDLLEHIRELRREMRIDGLSRLAELHDKFFPRTVGRRLHRRNPSRLKNIGRVGGLATALAKTNAAKINGLEPKRHSNAPHWRRSEAIEFLSYINDALAEGPDHPGLKLLDSILAHEVPRRSEQQIVLLLKEGAYPKVREALPRDWTGRNPKQWKPRKWSLNRYLRERAEDKFAKGRSIKLSVWLGIVEDMEMTREFRNCNYIWIPPSKIAGDDVKIVLSGVDKKDGTETRIEIQGAEIAAMRTRNVEDRLAERKKRASSKVVRVTDVGAMEGMKVDDR